MRKIHCHSQYSDLKVEYQPIAGLWRAFWLILDRHRWAVDCRWVVMGNDQGASISGERLLEDFSGVDRRVGERAPKELLALD